MRRSRSCLNGGRTMTAAHEYTLTTGQAGDGRTLGIISKGGHPQRPGSGKCIVCTIEDITGWDEQRVLEWYNEQITAQPWETRQ